MKILWDIKAVNCHGKFHNIYFNFYLVDSIPDHFIWISLYYVSESWEILNLCFFL